MKTTYFFILFACVGCSSSILQSTTVIRPNDNFILGGNMHGSFNIVLKNISKSPLLLTEDSVSGKIFRSLQLQPDEKLTLHVKGNHSLIVHNTSVDTAKIGLKVTGDLKLSMNYTKPALIKN